MDGLSLLRKIQEESGKCESVRVSEIFLIIKIMTIFTRIINGEIPSYRIAEDDYFLAFLDINPLREGHTLIIPKTETDLFFDLDEKFLSRILLFARPIAHAIEKSFPCNRCGISVI